MNDVAISRKQLGGESPLVASELFDFCIYTGLFGTIDSARMEAITSKLTKMVEFSSNDYLIIDLANVDAIDTSVASQLIRMANTMSYVGVKTIFCGINGILARTMVSSGVDLGQHKVERDLKSATSLCIQLAGYKLITDN